MAKSTATAEARLDDIVVNEVSPVDRAANKRTFLVVKSEGGAPDNGSQPTSEQPVGDPAAPAAPASEEPTAPITPDQAAVDADNAPTPPLVPTQPAPAPVNPEPETGTGQSPEPQNDDSEQPVDEVAKRGAKMRKERLARFKAAMAELHKIESELEQVIEEEEADTGGVKKSAEPNPLAGQVEDLTKQVDALTADKTKLVKDLAEQKSLVSKQADLLKKAGEPPAPNSKTPEGVVKKGDPFHWPNDLNEGRGK